MKYPFNPTPSVPKCELCGGRGWVEESRTQTDGTVKGTSFMWVDVRCECNPGKHEERVVELGGETKRSDIGDNPKNFDEEGSQSWVSVI